MKKKAWVSLFLTVVLFLLTAAVPAFAAAQSERVQTEAKTVAVASGKDDAGCGNIVTLFRDCFARLRAMLARIFPFLKDTSVQTFPTDDVRQTYGKAVAALDDYADYGFREVASTPLTDVSFDEADKPG